MRRTPLLTMLVIMAPMMLMSAGRAVPAGAGQKIELKAKRFSYEPSEITVKKGQPVTLVFYSQDVSHGFISEEFHVKTDIPKKGVSEVTFTPQQSGDFMGKCAHFCGAGHGDMQLKIHVTE